MVTADFNTWEAQTGATSDDALGHTCDYSFSICIHSSIFNVVHVFQVFKSEARRSRGVQTANHTLTPQIPNECNNNWSVNSARALPPLCVSQHVRKVKWAEQHVLSQSREAPEGFPSVWENIIFEKNAMFQAGGQADVPAHNVDAVVVQRARQVQSRLGRVLFQLEPLPRGDVVRLHRQHVFRLAGTSPPQPRVQLVGVATHQVDGVLHREHLLLPDVSRAGSERRPGVRDGAVLEDVCVPLCPV